VRVGPRKNSGDLGNHYLELDFPFVVKPTVMLPNQVPQFFRKASPTLTPWLFIANKFRHAVRGVKELVSD
jgi:hypothetical protein